MKFEKLTDCLYRVEDTCNVYLVTDGNRAVAIDFGSGKWVKELGTIGIDTLDMVFITHAHRDQVSGLLEKRPPRCRVLAPGGARDFLGPKQVKDYHAKYRVEGCPKNYAVPEKGIPGIEYVLGEGDIRWRSYLFRTIPTPGHTDAAVSIFTNAGDKIAAFCGDAAHAGATIHQPFHLEWDHWTGTGALAAWHGVKRLAGPGIDILCPSHGPAVTDNPRKMLTELAGKIQKFYESKLSICPGIKDKLVFPEILSGGFEKIFPHLYRYIKNGLLLVSDSGEALVIDPTMNEMEKLEELVKKLGSPKLTAAIVSHYHLDHCDAIPYLRKKHNTKAYLHPAVAKPLSGPDKYWVPWRMPEVMKPDKLLPENGEWQWNEYKIKVAHFPAQTWWHAVYQTNVDGVEVQFGGDNFQPAARWNGTGGFCSYNGCRFIEGWHDSAQLVIDWKPEMIVNGHGNAFYFQAEQFREIKKWALKAEKATAALCPSGDLEKDYYIHNFNEPMTFREMWKNL